MDGYVLSCLYAHYEAYSSFYGTLPVNRAGRVAYVYSVFYCAGRGCIELDNAGVQLAP